MKLVVLCADDYGLAPGVSRAIRQLVRARRLNATSVMTLFPDLPEAADALKVACGKVDVSIGLHVTLTGAFAPLCAASGERFPALSRRVADAMARRLDLDAVAAEVEAQFCAFRAAFGQPPHHVDGHQHVHVLPGIRAIVLDATKRHAPSAWLRDVTPAPATLRGLDPKARLIGWFARGFASDAAQAGLATSPGFAGAYDFGAAAAFSDLLDGFLKGAPAGGVIMVYPGHVDAELIARDPLTDQRAVEFAVLNAPGFPHMLKAAGARLF